MIAPNIAAINEKQVAGSHTPASHREFDAISRGLETRRRRRPPAGRADRRADFRTDDYKCNDRVSTGMLW